MSGGEGFELSADAPRRPRGRPKGATNKRSADLAGYIAAQIGSTPGQQAAAVAMVTQREIAAAAKVAKHLGLPPTVVALSLKATAMARLLGCTRAEAWEMMRKERAELLGYVHQKQPQAIAIKQTGGPSVIVMGGAAPLPMPLGEGLEIEGDFRALDGPVSRG